MTCSRTGQFHDREVPAPQLKESAAVVKDGKKRATPYRTWSEVPAQHQCFHCSGRWRQARDHGSHPEVRSRWGGLSSTSLQRMRRPPGAPEDPRRSAGRNRASARASSTQATPSRPPNPFLHPSRPWTRWCKMRLMPSRECDRRPSRLQRCLFAQSSGTCRWRGTATTGGLQHLQARGSAAVSPASCSRTRGHRRPRPSPPRQPRKGAG
mmetsp:Transcript_68680/g.223547  ORF Transcript_68680/g.223547 Transcript_68680/m.223547 type:complete len:209 (-) Transcript_68680:589-1215(-)